MAIYYGPAWISITSAFRLFVDPGEMAFICRGGEFWLLEGPRTHEVAPGSKLWVREGWALETKPDGHHRVYQVGQFRLFLILLARAFKRIAKTIVQRKAMPLLDAHERRSLTVADRVMRGVLIAAAIGLLIEILPAFFNGAIAQAVR
ncbi:hypothetical protein ACP_0385 [Acidobacterium capsulatum ATCC 51196]|uniref:Uncharacterized protein n=2 Tax=Acidobacteriaceae TaxID=204434 RepID=C1FA06_ACIC5|nr:hypothetical protein ACP_0385 [Acidobacterium capsulatum ATCC 51196]